MPLVTQLVNFWSQNQAQDCDSETHSLTVYNCAVYTS